jgi:hypothetical protein
MTGITVAIPHGFSTLAQINGVLPTAAASMPGGSPATWSSLCWRWCSQSFSSCIRATPASPSSHTGPFFLAAGSLLLGIPVYLLLGIPVFAAQRGKMTQPEAVP